MQEYNSYKWMYSVNPNYGDTTIEWKPIIPRKYTNEDLLNSVNEVLKNEKKIQEIEFTG
jgi:hypothetical protein